MKPLAVNRQLSAIIVANGKFPEHEMPLNALHEADVVICCDGATSKALNFGITPDAIVGDLDSISPELRLKYSDRLFHDPDQNTNDQTKAVKWCLARNLKDITIIGATGLREDHTIGNVGLLPLYARMGAKVKTLTDNGTFIPLLESSLIESFKGQQISIFSPNHSTRITSENLKYPLMDMSLDEFWMGTLNESEGDSFKLEFDLGPLIIFLKFP